MQVKRSIETRNKRNGFFFILPWCIGFLLFFLIPLFKSVAFSFCNVSVTTNGLVLKPIGLSNYKYIFYESAKFVDNLVDSITSFAYQIPIIIILSLIIAVTLNTKFKGRTIFRAILFIPVIISTGVIINFLLGDSVAEEMRSTTQSGGSIYMSGLIDFEKMFNELGLPKSVTVFIFQYVEEIFNLIWKSGIQIVLFISGLQSIPEQLYEVSKVEGANKIEEFWYITIPMLGNSIVLVIIYTALEFCASTDNAVMNQAYTILLNQQNYAESSAMMWSYFAIIAVILGFVFFLINKFFLKKWQ